MPWNKVQNNISKRIKKYKNNTIKYDTTQYQYNAKQYNIKNTKKNNKPKFFQLKHKLYWTKHVPIFGYGDEPHDPHAQNSTNFWQFKGEKDN